VGGDTFGADTACDFSAACSTLTDGVCTSPAVKDAGTKTCAADPCVAADFGDEDSNCCKAKPAATVAPVAASGAATAVVALTALLALVLAWCARPRAVGTSPPEVLAADPRVLAQSGRVARRKHTDRMPKSSEEAGQTFDPPRMHHWGDR
jgi:hypothetical protein